jgi:coniferyl-aldehyde dehydrogenase
MARLRGMVEQARAAGCEIIDLDAASGGVPSERRQMPLILVIDPPAHLDVMTQEVFGPVLPVITYDKLDAVLASINAGERPLAVYLYTYDKPLTEDILRRTTSGGACVNAALFHASIVSLPFGGSGNSGMGRHHGVEGFREFSNPRGVLMRSDGPDGLEAFNPPYRVLEAIAASVMTEPS